MAEIGPDYEGSWRCAGDTTKFCPMEGCPASSGCAREKGWDPLSSNRSFAAQQADIIRDTGA